uniref:SPARC (osteonectin), cwcv and kazal like domains proteoglycan 2 n=1 Tax=Neogobius melanostomus TaxID=47308 RepID=A0A8C6T973_9GOBI
MALLRIAPFLCVLVGLSLEIDTKSGKETPGSAGNFMEDGGSQWMSTVSQYGRKSKQWNRFRDVSEDYVKNTEETVSSDETDTTKDPCLSVKCSRNKVCVSQGFQRAVCVNRKKLEHRLKPSGPENKCNPCPVSPSAPVCGSDGHNYASECKLQQQACLTGKDLNILCSGFCPCTASTTISNPDTQRGKGKWDLCTTIKSLSVGPTLTTIKSRRSVVANCRDSITWMFSRLDSNGDQVLDGSELESINLDQYEVCVRPFFNSCDVHRDGRVTRAEWCICFWREKPPCLAELERIQVQEAANTKSTSFVPSCDAEGYYRKVQCDSGRGQCWCVDPHGGELSGTRIHGSPDCDEVAGYSGDFGSGVGWEDEEETGEDAGDEAEEEEEEEGRKREKNNNNNGAFMWTGVLVFPRCDIIVPSWFVIVWFLCRKVGILIK